MAIVTRLERKSRHWVQVWQGESETVATIVAGRLESDGVRTRIQGSSSPYRTSAMNLGGTWAILVPAGRAPLARDILREHDEGHNVIDDESGEGLTSSQRATLQFAIIAALVIILAGVVAELR